MNEDRIINIWFISWAILTILWAAICVVALVFVVTYAVDFNNANTYCVEQHAERALVGNNFCLMPDGSTIPIP